MAMSSNGYIPPHDLDAERAAIGACLVSIESAKEVTRILSEQDFYKLAHQNLFGAIQKVLEDRGEIDWIAIRNEWASRDGWDKSKCNNYLHQMDAWRFASSGADYYAYLVRQERLKRDAIAQMRTAAKRGLSDTEDIEDVLEDTTKILNELARSGVQNCEVPSVRDLIPEANERLEKRARGELDTVTSGLHLIDERFGGIEPGDFVIIRADYSVGKTALMSNIMLHHAVRRGEPAAVFQAEVSPHVYVIDLARTLAGVDLWRLENGQLSQQQLQKWQKARSTLEDAPLYLDHTSRISAEQIERRARGLVDQHDVSVIGVDHAQILTTEENIDRAVLKLTHISHVLKGIAQEHGVPVMLLSQETEDESGNAHAKWARALETDADVVLALRRDNQVDPEEEGNVCTRTLAIEKGKQKGTGVGQIWFHKPHLRMADDREELDNLYSLEGAGHDKGAPAEKAQSQLSDAGPSDGSGGSGDGANDGEASGDAREGEGTGRTNGGSGRDDDGEGFDVPDDEIPF